MNIAVTPARATVFMDPGLHRDDEKPDQSKAIMLEATRRAEGWSCPEAGAPKN